MTYTDYFKRERKQSLKNALRAYDQIKGAAIENYAFFLFSVIVLPYRH